MGERKVQAKYYPPDFDPSRLPRIKRKRPGEEAVRFMLPMSVRCETCGEFMGTGLKFNAKKSDSSENYLGIKIFRFSMKCKSCPATFTIKTDPKNSDYTCESGVRRNYEPWKEKQKVEDEGKMERERQDQNAIQALENKTADAKKELQDLDDLNQIKTENAQRASINVDDILAQNRAREKSLEDKVEEQLKNNARSAFNNKNRVTTHVFDSPTPSVPPSRVSAADKHNQKDRNNIGLLSNAPILLKIKKKSKKPKRAAAVERKQLSLTGLANYASSSDSD